MKLEYLTPLKPLFLFWPIIIGVAFVILSSRFENRVKLFFYSIIICYLVDFSIPYLFAYIVMPLDDLFGWNLKQNLMKAYSYSLGEFYFTYNTYHTVLGIGVSILGLHILMPILKNYERKKEMLTKRPPDSLKLAR